MHTPPVPLVLDPSGQDLHGEARRLRQLGPVAPVVLPGGVTAWAVNRYDLIKQVLMDPRVSKDAYRHWPKWISGEVNDSWPLAMWVSVRSMLTAYGEEHTRLRKLVAGAFTARRVADLQPRISEITDELLTRLEKIPPGHTVDLRREFAYELPIRVISELLGLEGRESHDFHRVVNVLFTTSTDPVQAQENQAELYALLGDLVGRKRAEPDADLTSALIATRDEDGEGLSEKELVDTLHLILGAGHETTVNLLDHTICALLTYPEQLRLVREGTVGWEDVVHETLRSQAPVANIPLRFAVEDIDLDGTVIPAGDPMVLSLVTAGGDPGTHGDDASTFDATRPTRRDHLAFGHGVHHCLGRLLAMSEATTALPALFERFPDMRPAVPADELGLLESFISSGHTELPVLLTPTF